MGSLLPPTCGNTLLTGSFGSLGAAPPLFGVPSGNSLLGALGTTPANTGYNSLLSAFGTAPPQPISQWVYVRQRFWKFLENLALTNRQQVDANTSQAGVRACLNRHYWGHSSETANSFLIGSWGKLTQVRPPRDVDVLFLLPPQVYHRFEARVGNRQSALLQEIKGVLQETYSRTTMHGDRHIVLVPFLNTSIEVVPGFRCQGGSIIVCDANNGGRYTKSTAEAEVCDLHASDSMWAGNTRALIRMMKQWQFTRNVPLKSFQLERLAVEFLATWPFRGRDVCWFDWMVRDFFGYLIGRANGYIIMPGTNEYITLGSAWLGKAQTAYGYAARACEYEQGNYQGLAGSDWQEIFGTSIPILT